MAEELRTHVPEAPPGVGITEPTVRAWLRREVAMALRLPEEEIDEDQDFTAMGLPSLEAVTLAGALEDRLGRELDASLLFDHPTIARLVRAVTETPDA